MSQVEPGSGADALVEKARTAALAIQRRDWEQGIVAHAFFEAGLDLVVIEMARAALIYSGEDGRVAVINRDGAYPDPAMLGEALLHAARITGDHALVAAEQGLRDYILHRAPRAADGTLYHIGEQMWVDSFNCAPPYLAAMGEYDEALRQIEGMRSRLWNPEKKLFSHQWDEPGQRFAQEGFWGVGNGWAAAGLTRVIRALPAERSSDRGRLISYLVDLLDSCLAHQRSDGFFHNFLDRPDTFVETNAAQMLAYSIYTGIFGGWLPESYRSAADLMRRAARSKVDEHGFVRDVCGAPHFDRPGIAAEGQAFFLLMETAAGKRQGLNQKP